MIRTRMSMIGVSRSRGGTNHAAITGGSGCVRYAVRIARRHGTNSLATTSMRAATAPRQPRHSLGSARRACGVGCRLYHELLGFTDRVEEQVAAPERGQAQDRLGKGASSLSEYFTLPPRGQIRKDIDSGLKIAPHCDQALAMGSITTDETSSTGSPK